MFPSSPAELNDTDVVVLSDIGADTLLLHPDTFERGSRTADRLFLLRDWVETGGGLLMIGGYMSFSGFGGRAAYQNTFLSEVLPVVMLGYDDRVERPSGVVPAIAESHPVLDGIGTDWPAFLGYNRVEPKESATVVLDFGADPLLVLGESGDGRTAAFTSDCAPHWAPPEFLKSEQYAQFWDQLIGWLAGVPSSRTRST